MSSAYHCDLTRRVSAGLQDDGQSVVVSEQSVSEESIKSNFQVWLGESTEIVRDQPAQSCTTLIAGFDCRQAFLKMYLWTKSFADVLIASIILLLTLPLILFLMILVKVTSRGPAIFEQVRLGKDGKPYPLYKIRTMTHDCERLTGPQWATSKDPRVTPLGRFLRRSHLDELPQLWNVVRGDMSLVGPRPERPEFVAKLEVAISNYSERLSVNPGMTGLAQIQLPPDETLDDVRRKVVCDLCYIDLMGPLLDLKIVVGTALKILGVPFKVTSQILDLPGVVACDPVHETSMTTDSGSLTQLQSI